MKSYQKTFKFENGRFWTCFEEIKLPPEPCEDANVPRNYIESLKQEDKANVNAHYDSKYYGTAIGESSNGAVSAPKIKQEYDVPKELKLEPKLEEVFPSHSVLVGCTKCYRYLMLPINNRVCPFCYNRAHTVEELEKK